MVNALVGHVPVRPLGVIRRRFWKPAPVSIPKRHLPSSLPMPRGSRADHPHRPVAGRSSKLRNEDSTASAMACLNRYGCGDATGDATGVPLSGEAAGDPATGLAPGAVGVGGGGASGGGTNSSLACVGVGFHSDDTSNSLPS
jgi:hypothetical protein